jgi:hypothetical protein
MPKQHVCFLRVVAPELDALAKRYGRNPSWWNKHRLKNPDGYNIDKAVMLSSLARETFDSLWEQELDETKREFDEFKNKHR